MGAYGRTFSTALIAQRHVGLVEVCLLEGRNEAIRATLLGVLSC